MKQSTGHVLMVRPVSFGYNPQTHDNRFQKQAEAVISNVHSEFDNMVNALRTAGVQVTVINDTAIPGKPDAVFPNNWFSTSCGRIILYPMLAENRRAERRQDIIDIISKGSYEIVDLSVAENDDHYLEGTGSLVLDHIHMKAYAAISKRTHPQLVKEWCSLNDYKPVMFTANDRTGNAIYHTNVMMCIGSGYAVICLDAIDDQNEKEGLINELAGDNIEIIDISMDQVNSFAGNMLEIEGDRRYLLMSSTAYNSLDEDQLRIIKKNAAPLPVPIPTIETIGGGSARCMVAEIF